MASFSVWSSQDPLSFKPISAVLYKDIFRLVELGSSEGVLDAGTAWILEPQLSQDGNLCLLLWFLLGWLHSQTDSLQAVAVWLLAVQASISS